MEPGAAGGLHALPEHAGVRLGRPTPSRKWFIPDGIHYYSPGYVARVHDFALGLAHAFPAGRAPNTSCLVR